jgi:hypothetical protein
MPDSVYDTDITIAGPFEENGVPIIQVWVNVRGDAYTPKTYGPFNKQCPECLTVEHTLVISKKAHAPRVV